ncbi:hypothetical protein D7X55_25915 [Corallococcus sp. AB049A]|uniref:Uncharacterized protein n=1 Tax=Corallococcus interemptor TaxID=2316720 RepID=A0A3A8QX14_9BACT|nr:MULTISPECIES: hypothetical protein [Corallococcus]RKH54289.1 hypothetical protein D7Y23_01140 [Corallococcus sp. AB050B]RKH72311.1 hypothetical protein D7X96_05280 [Corallococcus interemptor]RKI59271.1 hypothetical protein D7X55_25915 [Corallococcus sp. AB049A]
MSTHARWKLPLGTAGVLVLAVGAWLVFGGQAPEDTAPSAPPATVTQAPSPPPVFASTPAVPRSKDGGLDLVGAAAAQVQAAPPDEEPAPYPVDLEALRAKLPGNLYFEMDAPTKDPAELSRREGVKAKWNALYGKVLSNEASEEEVHQYYEHRRQVSEDAIAFATTMLQDYGDKLPSEHRGLLELSVNMHRTRLAEIPRQESDALARREAHAQRQKEWRAGGGRQP